MTTIQAVYENGVLRPTRPLALAEGQTVDVTVSEPQQISDEEFAQRLSGVQNLQEWLKVTELLPPDDGGYDILQALDENRRFSGERPPLSSSRNAS